MSGSGLSKSNSRVRADGSRGLTALLVRLHILILGLGLQHLHPFTAHAVGLRRVATVRRDMDLLAASYGTPTAPREDGGRTWGAVAELGVEHTHSGAIADRMPTVAPPIDTQVAVARTSSQLECRARLEEMMNEMREALASRREPGVCKEREEPPLLDFEDDEEEDARYQAGLEQQKERQRKDCEERKGALKYPALLLRSRVVSFAFDKAAAQLEAQLRWKQKLKRFDKGSFLATDKNAQLLGEGRPPGAGGVVWGDEPIEKFFRGDGKSKKEAQAAAYRKFILFACEESGALGESNRQDLCMEAGQMLLRDFNKLGVETAYEFEKLLIDDVLEADEKDCSEVVQPVVVSSRDTGEIKASKALVHRVVLRLTKSGLTVLGQGSSLINAKLDALENMVAKFECWAGLESGFLVGSSHQYREHEGADHEPPEPLDEETQKRMRVALGLSPSIFNAQRWALMLQRYEIVATRHKVMPKIEYTERMAIPAIDDEDREQVEAPGRAGGGAIGRGRSKQIAKAHAAEEMLRELKLLKALPPSLKSTWSHFARKLALAESQGELAELAGLVSEDYWDLFLPALFKVHGEKLLRTPFFFTQKLQIPLWQELLQQAAFHIGVEETGEVAESSCSPRVVGDDDAHVEFFPPLRLTAAERGTVLMPVPYTKDDWEAYWHDGAEGNGAEADDHVKSSSCATKSGVTTAEQMLDRVAQFHSMQASQYYCKWMGFLWMEQYEEFVKALELPSELELQVIECNLPECVRVASGPTAGRDRSHPILANDLLLVNRRPAVVTSIKVVKLDDPTGATKGAKRLEATLRLLDPREDDDSAFTLGAGAVENSFSSAGRNSGPRIKKVGAVLFGNRTPMLRQQRALQFVCAYQAKDYERLLLKPDGAGTMDPAWTKASASKSSAAPVPHVAARLAEKDVLYPRQEQDRRRRRRDDEDTHRPVEARSSFLEKFGLSETQRHAVNIAIRRQFTVIQGPPGTGKTYCAAIIAVAFLLFHPEKDAKCICCADSNVAADNFYSAIKELLKRFDFRKYGLASGPERENDGEVWAKELDGLVQRLGDGSLLTKSKFVANDEVAGMAMDDADESGERGSGTVVTQEEDGDGRAFPTEAQPRGRAKAIAEMFARIQKARILVTTCAGAGMDIIDKACNGNVPDEEVPHAVGGSRGQGTASDGGPPQPHSRSSRAPGAPRQRYKKKIRLVIADEATQSLETSTLVPMCQAGAGLHRLVLIGDHKQLAPTVRSRIEQSRDGASVSGFGSDQYSRKSVDEYPSLSSNVSSIPPRDGDPPPEEFGSLMSRLVNSGAITPLMLTEQRRMHPGIAYFPNKHFYDGKLKNHEPSREDGCDEDESSSTSYSHQRHERERNAEKQKQKFFRSLFHRLPPVHFIHVGGSAKATSSGNECRRGDSSFNEKEAAEVVAMVHNMRRWAKNEKSRTSATKKESKEKDDNPQARADFLQTLSVGVITPYNAQLVLLKQLLGDYLYQKRKHGKTFQSLSVDTIDGCQGCEKDVVLFSTVRSNGSGNLGFLSDPRRMNVALTRAKSLLLVFGDAECLRGNSSCWCRWVGEDVNLWPEWVQRFHFDRRNGDGDELEKHKQQSSTTEGRTSCGPSDGQSPRAGGLLPVAEAGNLPVVGSRGITQFVYGGSEDFVEPGADSAHGKGALGGLRIKNVSVKGIWLFTNFCAAPLSILSAAVSGVVRGKML
eukprot:g17788.t1